MFLYRVYGHAKRSSQRYLIVYTRRACPLACSLNLALHQHTGLSLCYGRSERLTPAGVSSEVESALQEMLQAGMVFGGGIAALGDFFESLDKILSRGGDGKGHSLQQVYGPCRTT